MIVKSLTFYHNNSNIPIHTQRICFCNCVIQLLYFLPISKLEISKDNNLYWVGVIACISLYYFAFSNNIIKMLRQTSFKGISLCIEYILKLSEQLIKIFSHIMSSNWVNVSQVVGGFPLMNVELSVGIVKSAIVIEYSSSNLQISKADTSGKSSQIINCLIICSEELKNLFSLSVLDVKNVRFGESGIVWAVGDRSGVVIAIKSVEEHMIRQ